MTWKITKFASPRIYNPILIEGLPGVGNVGKIATDYIIDSIKAKKLYEITSYNLPHCVFVNENNLVELPTIEVFYKNFKSRTLLFLVGDIQPLDEPSCYEFCDQVLDLIQGFKGNKEVITLGGIALDRNPKKPRIYAAANEHKIRKKYAGRILDNSMYGVVGPIVGVSGLLVGLAGKRKIPALSLLAETYGHPNHFGIRSARELLQLLNHNLHLKIDLSDFDAEIGDLSYKKKNKSSDKVVSQQRPASDSNYIG